MRAIHGSLLIQMIAFPKLTPQAISMPGPFLSSDASALYPLRVAFPLAFL
jgi:hypothetical protein